MVEQAQVHKNKWPRGWFVVARIEQVTDQAPLALRFFERDFIAWRDKNQCPIVMDALTHKNAHLRHGTLENGHIRCGVHGYLYDANGRCVQAPYEKTIPPEAHRTSWKTEELDGLLTIWYDPDHGEPYFRIPSRPEYHSADWVRWDMKYYTIPTHPREIVDNIADKAHFPVVHKAEVGSWETSFQGHKAHQLQKDSYVASDATYHGPSYLITRLTPPGFDSYMLVCHTPIEDKELGLWVGMMCHKGPKPLGEKKKMIIDGLVGMYTEGFFEDVAIWKNKKVPFLSPVLCRGDGEVAESRTWYDQFYLPRESTRG